MVVPMETATLTDQQVLEEIDVIEENMQVCGRRSSYTTRNRPYLKALYVEAEKRGLDIESA